MAIYEQWSTDPAQNNKAPPLGAPTGATAIKQLDDICRTIMAAIAEVAALAGTVGNASEAVRGIVELATAAEVQTGTDTLRAVTPAGLASRTATLTRAGIVELATGAETLAGADAARAVTPAGLATAIAGISLQAASTSAPGVVELATNAEAQAGADTARAVTPAALAAVTATLTRAGLVELATAAEMATGTDATRALTPKAFANNVTIANPGAITLPSGLIVRFGFTTTTTGGARAVTFASAYSNAINFLVGFVLSESGNYSARASASSASGFTMQLFEGASPAPSGVTFYWLAIGN